MPSHFASANLTEQRPGRRVVVSNGQRTWRHLRPHLPGLSKPAVGERISKSRGEHGVLRRPKALLSYMSRSNQRDQKSEFD